MVTPPQTGVVILSETRSEFILGTSVGQPTLLGFRHEIVLGPLLVLQDFQRFLGIAEVVDISLLNVLGIVMARLGIDIASEYAGLILVIVIGKLRVDAIDEGSLPHHDKVLTVLVRERLIDRYLLGHLSLPRRRWSGWRRCQKP
jgi:hypothetical protein